MTLQIILQTIANSRQRARQTSGVQSSSFSLLWENDPAVSTAAGHSGRAEGFPIDQQFLLDCCRFDLDHQLGKRQARNAQESACWLAAGCGQPRGRRLGCSEKGVEVCRVIVESHDIRQTAPGILEHCLQIVHRLS